jgi:glycosyltransferase involved in cell wall biosynthesis
MKYSFIVPVFNSEEYVVACLNSILGQKSNDYEIIIIDDGSKDKSASLIKEIMVENPQIIYLKQKNKGHSIARNRGINIAQGEYIIFVDSDDEVEEDLLLNLNKYTENNDVDIIRYRVNCIEEINSDRFEVPFFDNLEGVEALKVFCMSNKIFATPWTYAIKREIFINNNLFFAPKKFHEDFGLMPLLILKANKVSSIDFVGYKYIKRKNSLVTKTNHKIEYIRAKDFLYHYRQLIKYIKKAKMSAEYKKIFYEYFTKRTYIKLSNLEDEVKYKLTKLKTEEKYDD